MADYFTLLRDRVTLKCGSIDRIFLQAYVPKLLKTPHIHRYQLKPLGRTVAVLFTKTYGRVLAPGLILLDPKLPHPSSDAILWPWPGEGSTAPSTILQTGNFSRLENLTDS